MTPEIENLIKEDAKNVVDLLYETGTLDSKLTRDNMNTLEEYIRVLLYSRVNNHIKLIDLKSKLT
jgi:hypothetical protein